MCVCVRHHRAPFLTPPHPPPPPPEFDYPGVNVKGFPTLLFFPAGASPKVVKEYEGGRDLDGFIEYLGKNCAPGVVMKNLSAAGGDEEEEEEEEEL